MAVGRVRRDGHSGRSLRRCHPAPADHGGRLRAASAARRTRPAALGVAPGGRSSSLRGAPVDNPTEPFCGWWALVTGAGGGIGSALAEALAERGAQVGLPGRRRAPLARVSRQPGADWTIVPQADPTTERALVAALRSCQRHAGRLDLLVDASGIHLAAPLEQSRLVDRVRLLTTNVLGRCLSRSGCSPRCGRLTARSSSSVRAPVSSARGHRRLCGEPARPPCSRRQLPRRAEAGRGACPLDDTGRTETPMPRRIFGEEGRVLVYERLLQPAGIARLVVEALALPRADEVTEPGSARSRSPERQRASRALEVEAEVGPATVALADRPARGARASRSRKPDRPSGHRRGLGHVRVRDQVEDLAVVAERLEAVGEALRHVQRRALLARRARRRTSSRTVAEPGGGRRSRRRSPRACSGRASPPRAGRAGSASPAASRRERCARCCTARARGRGPGSANSSRHQVRAKKPRSSCSARARRRRRRRAGTGEPHRARCARSVVASSARSRRRARPSGR